jgi:hypothetical protein
MTDQEFQKLQDIEQSTWCIDDPIVRKEKAMRETARYPMLAKQMGLLGKHRCIDTSDMVIYDIGAGPLQGVSSILPCKRRVPCDPNKTAYSKYFNVANYNDTPAEQMKSMLAVPDLIISSNCIDHFQDPEQFLHDINKYMKYGAYFCHFHAIDNHITHPHEAHKFGINPEMVNNILSENFELVWHLDYQNDGLTYAWRKQPAFTSLWRRVNQPSA